MKYLIQFSKNSKYQHRKDFSFKFDGSNLTWLKQNPEIITYLGITKDE